jgi:hypothetical protein
MQRAVGDESPDSAFLRRAPLETGIRPVSPYPGFQIPPSTTTTAVPLVPVVPPQGTTDHHSATSTSSQQLPVPRITHPPRVGWYRQLLFELAEPVVLSAESICLIGHISPLLILFKSGFRKQQLGRHYWCRLWSSNTRKSEGKGKRRKTIRVGVGCCFKTQGYY